MLLKQLKARDRRLAAAMGFEEPPHFMGRLPQNMKFFSTLKHLQAEPETRSPRPRAAHLNDPDVRATTAPALSPGVGGMGLTSAPPTRGGGTRPGTTPAGASRRSMATRKGGPGSLPESTEMADRHAQGRAAETLLPSHRSQGQGEVSRRRRPAEAQDADGDGGQGPPRQRLSL